MLIFRKDPQFSPRRRYDKNWMIQHINKTRLIRAQIPSLSVPPVPPVTTVAQMAPVISEKVLLGPGFSLILRSPPDEGRPQDLKHLTPKPVRSRSRSRSAARIQGGKWCSSDLFHSVVSSTFRAGKRPSRPEVTSENSDDDSSSSPATPGKSSISWSSQQEVKSFQIHSPARCGSCASPAGVVPTYG